MKNLAISSALLAASSLAVAQSSVTLYGAVDTNIQRGSGSVADRTQVGSGGTGSSRLGFRGVEDLGGGLKASFALEGGFLADTGTGSTTNTNNQSTGNTGGGGFTFGRRSTVSLSGGWGELRLGRDYSAAYYNRFEFDPFGNSGVGASQAYVGALTGPIPTRVSNAIMYFTPQNLGGFYGLVQHYLGENPSNAGATKDDGTGSGLRFGYKAGPLNVAVSATHTNYATTATTGNITSANLGASYDFGDFSLMGGYYREKVDTVAGLTGRGPQIGGKYRVGNGEFKAQWSAYKTSAAGNPQTKKISLGYVHNLSKRTSLYGTFARVNNSGGATTALNGSSTAANRSSSGFDLGVRHNF